jgi:hypothetical protein
VLKQRADQFKQELQKNNANGLKFTYQTDFDMNGSLT